jgi:hypothetical protein
MQWNGVRARRQAGVAPRVCGRVGNGRGMEARQGAIRVFWGDTYPAILVPTPGADVLPQAHRSRTPRSPDARSCEAWAREKAGGRSRRVSREGTVREIAHRVKPNGGSRGAEAGKVSPKKMRMAPCRASLRLPFPRPLGKSGALPAKQRTDTVVARDGESRPWMHCKARRAARNNSSSGRGHDEAARNRSPPARHRTSAAAPRCGSAGGKPAGLRSRRIRSCLTLLTPQTPREAHSFCGLVTNDSRQVFCRIP